MSVPEVLLRGAHLAAATAVVFVIAGKTVGGYFGARLGGLPRREAARIGTLMNTRGGGAGAR
ncbi:hypothetical protein FNH05_17315 [Amycolatopsis rhizosphaerae]|uniref:Uncharacterized protein n=1 Tax=Amycolatopsis rhizosphaerae TaxID=2053003 RepID=A0A558CJD3_9PSEU|nr:hypothetical protein [Amycolatopsis rhizosphaerae]TVT48881.1 hypothetical protein FNH05_17315 [Amycolatopsis rhizosphaerae]